MSFIGLKTVSKEGGGTLKLVYPASAVKTVVNDKNNLGVMLLGETDGIAASTMIGFDNYTDAIKWLIANDPE
jgi:hypothetical protein